MTEFVERAVGKAALPLAIAYCLFVSGLIFANYVAASKFGNDFSVYWRAANQPLGEIYFWKGRFPFPYAPTMLLWIQPLALIGKWPAYFLFVGGSVTAFFLAYRNYVPKIAIVLALISPPVARGLFTGQVCALTAAMTIWACGTANRIGAGIAFAVIASIKPQLVIMAPIMLAFNRDWRAFISAGTSFVVIILLSVILFGTDRWPEWIASMGHFHHAVVDTNVINIGTTPAAVAERFGYPPIPLLILGTIGGAMLTWSCRNAEPLEKAAAITLGSIMAAPYALAYDLTAVMPLLALLVLRGRILAAIGIASPHHPLPLVISIYELWRDKLPRFGQKNALEPA